MRASTVFVALAACAASVMAMPADEVPTGVTSYTIVPTGTGSPTPPNGNGTTNGTHTPTPEPDSGASVSNPAGLFGLAAAGIAVIVAGVAL